MGRAHGPGHSDAADSKMAYVAMCLLQPCGVEEVTRIPVGRFRSELPRPCCRVLSLQDPP